MKKLILIFMLISICISSGEPILFCNDSAVTADFTERLKLHADTANPVTDSVYLSIKKRELKTVNDREFAYYQTIKIVERTHNKKEIKVERNTKRIQGAIFALGSIGGLILWISPAYK
jgi:hypothetical protein